VTLSEWQEELRELRADLGATRRMRLRWRLHTPIIDGRSVLDLLAGHRSDDEALILALYAESAVSGARPIAEVHVQPSADIEHVEQGCTVDVAGLPATGHAVVVIIDGRQYWPTYPCTLSLRAPKL
jgi:hypothetical protein